MTIVCIIMGDDMRDEGLWIQPFVNLKGALVVI
jgi:hypothetical protein